MDWSCVWSDRFPESQVFFPEAKSSRKIQKLHRKSALCQISGSDIRNIQSPKECNSMPPAMFHISNQMSSNMLKGFQASLMSFVASSRCFLLNSTWILREGASADGGWSEVPQYVKQIAVICPHVREKERTTKKFKGKQMKAN